MTHTMNRARKRKNAKGFTLVELSIVLVIIGLIVSGVLVGQDLIQAAQIRSQLRQVQDLDSAINTFRAKYNGLPGDLDNALNFGLVAADPTAGTQGNGLIEGSLATATDEAGVTFEALSNAQLIPDRVAAAESIETRLERGHIAPISVSDEGLNYWILGVNEDSSTTMTTGTYTGFEAWSLDSRMDDGMPNTGLMRAAQAGTDLSGETDIDTARGTPTAANCAADLVAATEYIIDTASTTAVGNLKVCPLVMRISG